MLLSNLQNPPYAMCTTSMCLILLQQCCQPSNASPWVVPASIHSAHQYKLPQRKESDYSELFISALAHLFPINLNINCCYAIKIIETIK
jgi:hypothetical protein